MTQNSRLIRADLHNHTHFSPDSILSPRDMLKRARRRKIDVIAVTDHNTARGGQECAKIAAKDFPDVRVIVGEEVKTADGEVLGLFLSEDIPRGLSASETIDRIHAQGGVAGAPHPFDPYRTSLGEAGLNAIVGKLDFMEGLNARIIRPVHNDHACGYAARHGIALSAASDAHSPREVGRCYVEMPDFATPDEFIASLRAGSLRGKLSSPMIHLISRYSTMMRKLGLGGPRK